ncbi:MAG TPA: DUF86 domain-containing protein [Patescibacteria group bacterium]
MSKRLPKLYLEDILTALSEIEEFVKGMSQKDFESDRKTMHAVVRNIEIIGEAARNLPEDFVNKHPELPIHEMITMRNRVVHEYFGIDLNILWQTIVGDLPQLKKQIKDLV